MIILVIVAVLALGGGASFVAESSVPGDALYVVKTSVNEEVRGILAVGAEADAKWEAELAVRRLEEATKLEARGELTAEAAAALNAEFTTHAEAAVSAAENIGSSGQDGVSVMGDIRTTLDAAVDLHAALFVARDSASGQATGKRTFVLPHVLEASFEYDVKAPRDVATGQSSGMIQTGDVDGDGAADVAADGDGGTIDSETNVEAKSGSGSVEMKASYDLKTNTR